MSINRQCPDPNVAFYLYTKNHPDLPEGVRIGADPGVSNLSQTDFNPALPSKIIIHGYNSDMNLNALVEVRKRKYFFLSIRSKISIRKKLRVRFP